MVGNPPRKEGPAAQTSTAARSGPPAAEGPRPSTETCARPGVELGELRLAASVPFSAVPPKIRTQPNAFFSVYGDYYGRKCLKVSDFFCYHSLS